MKYEQIIRDFDAHINKSGRYTYGDFYVGITNNVERRLFEEHRVPREGHWWIYSPADSECIAREVEKHYLDCGMHGSFGGGKGDGSANIVYCYVISPNTVE